MLADVFVPLSLNIPHQIVARSNGNVSQYTLTLIDANHCPGAVMILITSAHSKVRTFVVNRRFVQSIEL